MEYRTENLILRSVTEDDLSEVARTWPAERRPVSEAEARAAITRMRRSHERNAVGSIAHLCLAVCGIGDPRTILGWCGLDGRRSPAEPEIFILLDEDHRSKGYGTQCVKELLRIAAEDFSLPGVHGGCGRDNYASQRAMEKGGMERYGSEENGDPLYRFPAAGQGRTAAVPAEKDLQLYVPYPEDGWFYVKMMSDPATMAYNAPWFPPDGCIPDPASEWKELQASWIGRSPTRFYAFLRRRSDGAFVGDVNYHRNAERDWWDMGVVIYAPERGKGYGKQGLRLLAEQAFRIDGISRLRNDFETTRGAACHIHKAVGFRELGTEDGMVRLELTREGYLSQTRP